MRTVTEKELDVFELELAIKWAHAATLMDKNPEVSYLFALSETAFREKLERLNSAPPPNDPLTLEELREMVREPVWVVHTNGAKCWHIIHEFMEYAGTNRIFWKDGGTEVIQDLGVIWTAYRRKPEENRNAET